MRTLNLVIGITVLLTFGVLASLWPQRVCDFYRKRANRGWMRGHPFTTWMNSSSYVVVMRIMGVVALLAAVFVFLAWIES